MNHSAMNHAARKGVARRRKTLSFWGPSRARLPLERFEERKAQSGPKLKHSMVNSIMQMRASPICQLLVPIVRVQTSIVRGRRKSGLRVTRGE